MPVTRREARRDILSRLLEAYERSKSYGRPGPWRRDVAVRLDPKEFPEAFGPEGRELLIALRNAAEELAQKGALRLLRHRGWAHGEIREFRLGPGEVAVAYVLAGEFGFEPLATGLSALRASAVTLRPGMPEWMDRFLESVEERAANADLSPLGMQRERFKREWRDTVDALTAAAALARGISGSGWERVVSERLFKDSKRLSKLRTFVANILLSADPRWDAVEPDDDFRVLEEYGIRRKPGLLRCSGDAEIAIGERNYRLSDFAPAAHLPEAWAGAWVEGIVRSAPACITTVENEYPFLSYVEQEGGPLVFGSRRELVVFTSGFPSVAVMTALIEINRRATGMRFRHWGDADWGGVRIWWLLRQRLGRAVELFRTDSAWLEMNAAIGGTELAENERLGLRRLREKVVSSSARNERDARDAIELVDTMLRLGIKVEQERY
jgi:hypothetical protein